MNRRDRVIPEDVLRAQIEASNPSLSAFVAANAGSGKTYVLAQRVIRLMLNDTPPNKILCLTFTKAAAANMANQVFDRLAKWVALEDVELDAALAKLEGTVPSPARRARARRLFAEALDAPGGLKVQTIHAFCTRLLQQFPFEAKVAARFVVLDERAENELIARLRLEVLLKAAGDPDGLLGGALAIAIAASADRTFGAVIDEMIGKRDEVTAWLATAGGVDGASAQLSALLGLTASDTLAKVEAEMTQSPLLPPASWPAIAAVLASGQAFDCAQSERLIKAAAGEGEDRSRSYAALFLTSACAPRQQLVSKPIAANHPELVARLYQERDRILELSRKRCALRTRERSGAILSIAAAVIARYRDEKAARGLLDYADLIDKTLALLTDVEAAWVHFKLDLGIDHVLIDEAQDTSPKQWEIIKRLVAEFTAGEGARGETARSIFAVGDEKQSIFSFQDAAPYEFTASREHFERVHREAGLKFLRREFKHSFRSGANLLSAIDVVFGDPQIAASVTTDPSGMPPHHALPEALPGLVEIWPVIAAKKRDEGEAWDAPFDEVTERSPQVTLAQQIATRAGSFIAAGRRPGDLLILVRQRGALFEAILRALKNAAIAVAGADRLVLTEHIAVMDLLALADALLLPSDDLALATVLKSPLFGFDDALLFRLAWRRKRTLRGTLKELAGEDLFFAQAAAKLSRLDELARHETPFGFYAQLLGREQGRKHMLARLGAEAADPLDEFLNLALDYERRAPPSLQGFIDHIRASATEVKRDMDIARDEVRVMTVHGAKGLEAPIVFLADTTTRPTGPRDPRLIALTPAGSPSGAPGALVWATGKNDDIAPMAQAREKARQAAQDEYRRLLYVAMTRAAEVLIICAAQGLNGKPADCWYDLVFNALSPQATKEPGHEAQGEVWRWRRDAGGPQPPSPPRPRPAAAIKLPDWLTRDAPSLAPGMLRPSSAHHAETIRAAGSRLANGQEQALERGRILHRLAQALPELAMERRAEAARHYVDAHAPVLDDEERSKLTTEILGLLSDPSFATLFGPQTRAEVPLVGRFARNGRPDLVVSGQVDLIATTPGGLLVVDLKTDRPAPKELAKVPPGYVTQLALYTAVLARICPGQNLRAGLLFTETPALMEIPGPVLEQAFATVLVA
jgi:ATP-dependent helicase/nuclease subunit A